MRIRALQALTIMDGGYLQSIPYGGNAEVDNDAIAQSLITNGLAEEYTTTSPFGTLEVSNNGVFDCFNQSEVAVSVPQSGGGGSEFTTAKLRFVSAEKDAYATFWGCGCGLFNEDDEPTASYPFIYGYNGAVVSIPLYQGLAFLAYKSGTEVGEISGSYERVNNTDPETMAQYYYIIKGDCTITLGGGGK